MHITIEISAATARRLAGIALTLLVGGVAGAAYALPVTFESGARLTADQLNQNFGELDQRLASALDALNGKANRDELPVITEWKAFEPQLVDNRGIVVEGQVGTGFYRRVGDSLELRVYCSFSGVPQQTAIWWQWLLPDDLNIDLLRAGAVGLATVGGGLAQTGESANFSLEAYVRSSRGVSATPSGGRSYYLDESNPTVVGPGSQLSLYATVPIVGWTVTTPRP